ncbi:MAG: hypothetical protein FJ125_15650, partial [Deltaproteobacteria bacterium]|nr:hypothetical protein [Deltaproteobacteria bacterium]
MQAFDNPRELLTTTALVDRFLSYVVLDTQSDAKNESRPSTPGQRVLLEKLKAELLELGLPEVDLDENGFLIAGLPGNCPVRP